MSEPDRAPLIQLSVDQEVFIDTVRDGDVIEDATVATEVTSFDRVDDAYVLEGAIVFAGYLTGEGVERGAEAGEFDSLSIDFDGGSIAKHVHHRMPFVLRVPVNSQPRGIVNVASRLAAWNLEVISTGWIRVVADLNIVGLNGSQGYHFQCGAQEAGDLFFDPSWDTDFDTAATRGESPTLGKPPALADPTVYGDPSMASHSPGTNDAFEDVSADSVERELEWARGVEHSQFEADSGGRHEDAGTSELQGKVEALSDARGGHEPLDAHDSESSVRENSRAESELGSHAPEERRGDDMKSESHAGEHQRHETESSARQKRQRTADSQPASDKDELRSLDHVLDGQSLTDQAEDHQTDESAPPSTPVVEFEFEHQVSAVELSQSQAGPELPAESTEDFVPSRSFSDDEFHATAGFVPTVRVGSDLGPSQSSDVDLDSDDFARSEHTPSVKQEDWGDETTHVDKDLWSFVDFNGPEAAHTLRFAIVMEEETLELVAERLGCSKADLMRVNRLTDEPVYPGRSLLIPSTASTLVH
jgi:hypothetical protein